MKAVDIEWRAGAERFEVRGGNGVVASVDAPRFDPASRPAGPGPAEMLLAAAGTCSAWDVVEILEKQRQAVSAIDVRVEGMQDDDPPWAFRRIAVRFVVTGRDLDPERVARAVELSESRYCSVIAPVRGTADVVVTTEVVAEAPGAATAAGTPVATSAPEVVAAPGTPGSASVPSAGMPSSD